MTVTVREAATGDRELLSRLVDYYFHDFSEFDGRDLDWDGSYHYEWLDAYWTDDDRRAYLFDVEGHPAGFALVRLTDPLELAEFFILRKYRRSGIGTDAARNVICRHPGRWTISEIGGNAAATVFWRRAIPAPFEERQLPDGHVEQVFETAG
ncbi:MAG: GNAT family N-acetyltransferase [Humibacter sp.]